MITRNVHADGNKFALGKNRGYTPSSLGGRSINVGRQAGSEIKFVRFDGFNSANSKAKSNCLNSANSSVKRDSAFYLKEMLL